MESLTFFQILDVGYSFLCKVRDPAAYETYPFASNLFHYHPEFLDLCALAKEYYKKHSHLMCPKDEGVTRDPSVKGSSASKNSNSDEYKHVECKKRIRKLEKVVSKFQKVGWTNQAFLSNYWACTV